MIDLGETSFQCAFCGAVGFECENRGNGNQIHFGDLCCRRGKTDLDPIPAPPAFFTHLYTAQDEEGVFFRSNIRRLNSSFSMAAMVVNDQTVSHQQSGVASFRIKGQLLRTIGSIRSSTEDNCSFLQTYFYEEHARRRTSYYYDSERGPEGDMFFALCQTIHQELISCGNTYLQSFLAIPQVIERLQAPPQEIRISIHADCRPSQTHIGRYGLPQCCEVAILMPNEVAPTDKRQIVVQYREGQAVGTQLKFFDDTHRSYDPLAYPLLFPLGTDGWNVSLEPVTLRQYLAYHIAVRPSGPFSVLHQANKLFQQWLVDQFCKMETARIKYIRTNQKKIRADLYQGVVDSIHNGTTSTSGTPIILPPSFIGSPRCMHARCQDALAICSKSAKHRENLLGTT